MFDKHDFLAVPADKTVELASFRQQIDAIDDKLIQLLIERIGVVSHVGELKRKTAPGQCPIRPGREAEQLRRIMARFEGTSFPPAAAAALWRIVIGASTSVESPLTLSVYTPERDDDLYWVAREYFGPTVSVIRHPQVKRIIGDVMDGKASVGIVPLLRDSDTSYWWTNLVQPGKDIPKIFARIPFILAGAASRDAPLGYALARIAPEPSGDDHSLLVLEADHNVSQNRLQGAFSAASLDVRWINVASLVAGTRHHLIEVKGFVPPTHPTMQTLLSGLGASVVQAHFLGAYATPATLAGGDKSADAKPGFAYAAPRA